MLKNPSLKTLCLALFLVIACGAFSGCESFYSMFYSKGYEPDQPINYSHKIHAGDNQMQCLYCHVGAERGPNAGIPPANVCMNCHWMVKTDSPEIQKLKKAVDEGKPIEWVKVHNLPDYVRFNHSRHVKSGMACQECHGPIETMAKVRQVSPLTMGWCLDCHRAKGIAAPVQDPAKATGSDCSSCHY